MEIRFEQVAVVADVHPVFVDADLLDEQIVALMHAVEHQLDAVAARRPGQRGHRRDLHRHQVAHHRAVHEIGQQHPAFVRREPEERNLAVELEQIGFLGPPPGCIAPAADVARQGFRKASPVFQGDRRLDIVFLRHDPGTVLRIDVQERQTGLPGAPHGAGVFTGAEERIGQFEMALRQTDAQAHLRSIIIVLAGIADIRAIAARDSIFLDPAQEEIFRSEELALRQVEDNVLFQVECIIRLIDRKEKLGRTRNGEDERFQVDGNGAQGCFRRLLTACRKQQYAQQYN